MATPVDELPDEARRAIDAGDLDETIRWVERLADDRRWDSVQRVATASRKAHDRGHQLWPAATYANFRTALDAPDRYAAAVLTSGSAPLSLGPLTEVAAQNHTFDGLRPLLSDTVVAHAVATECLLRNTADPEGRGESEREAIEAAFADELASLDPLPSALQRFESLPDLPHYETWRLLVDGAPPLPPGRPLEVGDEWSTPSTNPEAADAVAAWTSAFEPWATRSGALVTVVGVDGPGDAAIRAVADRAGRRSDAGEPARSGASLMCHPIDGAAAISLVWSALSTAGPRARRIGGAAGRSRLWEVLAATTGLDDQWPPDPAVLADAVNELEWCRWTFGGRDEGHDVRLAVTDPLDGLSWALDATVPTETDDDDAVRGRTVSGRRDRDGDAPVAGALWLPRNA